MRWYKIREGEGAVQGTSERGGNMQTSPPSSPLCHRLDKRALGDADIPLSVEIQGHGVEHHLQSREQCGRTDSHHQPAACGAGGAGAACRAIPFPCPLPSLQGGPGGISPATATPAAASASPGQATRASSPTASGRR